MLDLEQSAKTVVLLAIDGIVEGLFGITDTVKQSSKQAISELKEIGMQPGMLTGDNLATAEAIASQLGIKQIQCQPPARRQNQHYNRSFRQRS